MNTKFNIKDRVFFFVDGDKICKTGEVKEININVSGEIRYSIFGRDVTDSNDGRHLNGVSEENMAFTQKEASIHYIEKRIADLDHQKEILESHLNSWINRGVGL